jgi:hypothetical protein
MELRVQIQLMRGQQTEARRTAFAMLELLERANLGKSLLGALFQVVLLTDRYISSVVIPCAMAGALSAEDLAEIYRRGRAVGYDVGSCAADLAAVKVFEVFGSNWTKNFNTGSAGLPKLALKISGKVGVEDWYDGMETKRAGAIAGLEAELPALLGEEYMLKEAADFKRVREMLQRVLFPLLISEEFNNVEDMYLAQLRWVEVWIRAEEARQNLPLGQWPNPMSAIDALPGYLAKINGDTLEVWADVEWFKDHGVNMERKSPEFVMPLKR